MKVYLDNNVFISIENKEFEFEALKSAFGENVSFVYSYAHIQELLEAKSDFNNLKEKRLKTISEITNDQYLFQFGDKIESKTENPQKVLDLANTHSLILDIFRKTANKLSIDRERFISFMNIDKKRLNNYSSREVIEQIDHALNKKRIKGFENVVNMAGTNLHARISTIFNFLDVVGYWKDSKTNKSNLARMYDATHTYFASDCEYFISNDRRARYKAAVAFELYNIETKVISFKECITG